MATYAPPPPVVSAQERAGTKKQVSNGLALRLVAQLYQLGVVEAARPAGAKRTADVVELREVSFSAHLLGALKRLLADLNITTVTAVSCYIIHSCLSFIFLKTLYSLCVFS